MSDEGVELTVRELIVKLVRVTDLDSPATFTFHGTDPIPVKGVEENEEGQVVLTDYKS